MKSVSSTPERPIRADDAQIEQAIASLANLDHAALKERWRVLQGGDPPRRLSRQLLLRALAHAMQEKVFGGLSPMVGQRLRRLAEELRATGRISSIGKQPVFKPGTRLIREWQGRTHEVIVLEHGFQWKGETYRSLSAIARAITGTRWNGHVFFGLKSRQSPCSATDSPSDHSAAGACKRTLRLISGTAPVADRPKRAPKLRCAIYTRKSSEEGLEQEFNSLQAQREACEAFITSQKGEGWQTLPAHYDDGGWSGGTLDRPALQRLLADIRASKVDVVVVYKIDRLTRSLLDFAKIVEVFDAHGVSFVSVTQAFNTSTSMGRLTLNVLLSFAQFEREVTGERIRDKIAASKQKGMWMGGFVPLGYDVKDRMLVINKEEAESVRFIFRRYLELGSVYKLKAELDAKRITSKRRLNANGKARGGRPIAAGALYHLLQNPIYCGRIGHKGQSYEGMHEAIIEPELWEAVQRSLEGNSRERRNGTSAKEPSLLAGLIVDAEGKRLDTFPCRQRRQALSLLRLAQLDHGSRQDLRAFMAIASR